MDDTAPVEARITLSGFERAFNLLDPSTLKVSINLDDVGEGTQSIAIEPSQVKHPPDLDLFRTDPSILDLEIHRWIAIDLPIKVITKGLLAEDQRLNRITADPASVRVLMWDSKQKWMEQVDTEPVDLSRVRESTKVKAKLRSPKYVQFLDSKPPQVTVTVEVGSAADND